MSMKSTLLTGAAAVAAVVASAGAGAAEIKGSVHADLRFGIDYFDNHGVGAPADTNFENHGSYWGVKGSAEQRGITAFGGYERWLDSEPVIGADLVRQAYAGVSGSWGTVQYGTFATAYMEAGRKLDPFFATGAAGVGQPAYTIQGGHSHGLSPLTADVSPALSSTVGGPGIGGFVSNQLALTSPRLWGFSVNGAVMFDDNAGDDAEDDYAGGVEWTGWNITAGVQHLNANGAPATSPLSFGVSNTGLPANTEATRLYASYAQERWGVAASGEQIDLPGSGAAAEAEYGYFSAWYGVLEGTRVAASYGYENQTGAEGQSFRVGVFHDILDNFTTHVVYRNFNDETDGVSNPDDEVISLGASFKFDLNGAASR